MSKFLHSFLSAVIAAAEDFRSTDLEYAAADHIPSQSP